MAIPAGGSFAGGGEILRLARGSLEEPTWGALGVYFRTNVVGTRGGSAAAEGESWPDRLSHNPLYGTASPHRPGSCFLNSRSLTCLKTCLLEIVPSSTPRAG